MLRFLKRLSLWSLALVAVAAFGLGAFRLATDAPPEGYGNVRAAEVSRDCDDCPEMLPIPAGAFTMGSEFLLFRHYLSLDALPRHKVEIAKPFEIGRFEVTFDEWDACVADGGCNDYEPSDEGYGRGKHPVINVSWNDAQAYAAWLSRKTGRHYRLPSEAEWEYAARAGVDEAYPWGRWPNHDRANYGRDKCCVGDVAGADKWMNTAPVGQFPPNRFGLYDVAGNVYEWVEDCYDPYVETPTNGSADETGDCTAHPMRGGAWYSNAERVRSSYRALYSPNLRARVVGFRIARDA